MRKVSMYGNHIIRVEKIREGGIITIEHNKTKVVTTMCVDEKGVFCQGDYISTGQKVVGRALKIYKELEVES